MFANKSTNRKHFNKDIFLCHGHHLRLKAHPAAAITHKRSQTLLRYSKIKHAFPHITVTPTVELHSVEGNDPYDIQAMSPCLLRGSLLYKLLPQFPTCLDACRALQ